MFNLKGKTALVTGGGAGLGREFCDVLAEYGAAVACCDLRNERAQETCNIIKDKYAGQTLALNADVSHFKQVQAMFQQVKESFGRLDILVNNAGITTQSALIHQVNVIEWEKLLNVNLNGVFFCMKEGVKLMLNQKRGSIINVASILGLCASDPEIFSKAPYVASKAAIIGLTREGAVEYGRFGIRVNCIAPGWFPSTRLEEDAGIKETGFAAEKFLQELALKTPMKRMGKPGDLRGLLIYLASDASSFTTGQVIAVDGGWTCL